MTYRGELEVDTERGVIYFHTDDPELIARIGTQTLLRIQGLSAPISVPFDLHGPRVLDMGRLAGE